MLAIPGHAEYCSDRILAARERLEEAERNGERHGSPEIQLLNEQMYGFQTLALLPSPEIVRVLGEFLFDDRGKFVYDPKNPPVSYYHSGLQQPNSGRAVMALTEFIDNPPIPPRGYFLEQDLHPWRLWYEQVKAGNRTFRFKGDPKEYSLTGVVAERTNPASSGGDHPRPVREVSAADGGEAGEEPPVAVIAIGALLVLLSALFFFRGRGGRAD